MSATTILNEILQKLSKLSDEQPDLQELSETEVQEEVVEAVSETTEEVKEEATTELSEEVATYCNELEEMVPDSLWTLPKYFDMLFLR